MKTFITLVLGALLGAALFHAFYLHEPQAAKCRWDHPLDREARAQCESDGKIAGYAKSARKQLNDLIDNVAQ